MNSRERVLVFDFDGTVSLGHGPIRSYARFIAATLPIARSTAFLEAFETGLADPALPAGSSQAAPIDGYDLVRLLAVDQGVTAGVRSAAYLSSRVDLATPNAPVIAPDGLAGFLAVARQSATVVLATNAPPIRLDEALAALGLAGAFDAVHASVGKPAGFAPLLDSLLTRLPAGTNAAHGLLSIVDVWANDLEPAHSLGASTALVGGHAPPTAAPTYSASHLSELYPALLTWLGTDPVPGAGTPDSSPLLTAPSHRKG